MIRRAGPDDVELVRPIRLAALADTPSAFASTYARKVAMPLRAWEERLASTDAITFVALAGTRALGLAVGAHDATEVDLANLYSMWVRAEERGSGVADELVAHVAAWARAESKERLRLFVTEGNTAAERLYARHGFAPTGVREPRERDGLAEIELVLPLSA